MFCEKCGKQLPDGSAFCDGCGAPVAASAPAGNEAESGAGGTAVQAPVAPRQPLNKKALIGIVAAVAVVIVVILLIALIAGGGSDTPLLYVTDGELVNNVNIKKNETIVIDDEYISSDMQYGFVSRASAAQALVANTALTADGKKFAYLADYDGDDGTYTLFWIPTKKLSSSDAGDETVKVASGVSSFRLAEDADAMLYTKDSKLYFYNFKDDAQLVAKDVNSYQFVITADGKSIAYVRDDDGEDVLYTYSVKTAEATKVDSGVDDVYSWDRDNGFQSMLYSKYDESDGTSALYRAGAGTDKTKLFSDASTIIAANPDGYAFYVEQDEDWNYTLYAYDMTAGEKTELAEDYNNTAYSSAKNGVIAYSTYEDGDEVWYLSVKGAEGEEFDERIATGSMSEDGKTLYLIEYEEGEREGELVSYTVGKDGASGRTKLTEDVYIGYLRRINGTLTYMVDFDDGDYTGTLYAWDGKEVKLADEVYRYGIDAYGEDGIAFFADPDDNEGIMYLFDGKNATKVASDVYMYNWTEFEGDLLFLSDFDEDDGGTLYQFDGKDKTKIASDVQAIIPLG